MPDHSPHDLIPSSVQSLPGLTDAQHRQELATRFGQASLLLLLLYTGALVATSIPIRLLDSGWQLSMVDLLISNAPIAITSACLAAASLALTPTSPPAPVAEVTKSNNQPPKIPPLIRALEVVERITTIISSIATPSPTIRSVLRSKANFKMACLTLSWIYIVLMPVEIAAGLSMIRQINAEHRASIQSFLQYQQKISMDINASSSMGELSSLLSPGSKGVKFPGGLIEQKSLLRKALEHDQVKFREKALDRRRQRLRRLGVNALRTIPAALMTGIFFRLFSSIFFHTSFKPSRQALDSVETMIH